MMYISQLKMKGVVYILEHDNFNSKGFIWTKPVYTKIMSASVYDKQFSWKSVGRQSGLKAKIILSFRSVAGDRGRPQSILKVFAPVHKCYNPSHRAFSLDKTLCPIALYSSYSFQSFQICRFFSAVALSFRLRRKLQRQNLRWRWYRTWFTGIFPILHLPPFLLYTLPTKLMKI